MKSASRWFYYTDILRFTVITTLRFSTQFKKKCSNLNIHVNKSSDSRVSCGQTHKQMEKQTNAKNLKVAFRNFLNAPKNVSTNNLKTRGRQNYLYIIMAIISLKDEKIRACGAQICDKVCKKLIITNPPDYVLFVYFTPQIS
jgi:hypothetical protein